MRNVAHKSCRENQNTFLGSIILFSPKTVPYVIYSGKSTVHPEEATDDYHKMHGPSMLDS